MLSRLVAAILLAFVIGFLMYKSEQSTLARLQAMTPEECLEQRKHLVDHTYAHAVALVAVLGIIYMVLLEGVAFVLRRGWRRPEAV